MYFIYTWPRHVHVLKMESSVSSTYMRAAGMAQ